MTGEELLTMFCRLRGIPEKKIPHIVKTEIKRLDLEKYAKKRCGTYRLVYGWCVYTMVCCICACTVWMGMYVFIHHTYVQWNLRIKDTLGQSFCPF